MQDDLWAKKYKKSKDFILPLFIYEDDFECGNALGSHAGKNKLGGIYASVPALAPHILTQLDYIFVTQLYYANDRKHFGNHEIYRTLITELNDLKINGLVITVNGKNYKIYF